MKIYDPPMCLGWNYVKLLGIMGGYLDFINFRLQD